MFHPESLTFTPADSLLFFRFDENTEATVQVSSHETHLTFELTAISGSEQIELVVWGPYPTVLDNVIGETVGVVQGDTYAIGLQALNMKTLGGYPWNENDAMPQLDIFESGDFSDLSEEGKRHVLYRVEAAKPDSFGSTLQAYTRNRNTNRIIKNWGHVRYLAPAYNDGGIFGSKISLFGSPKENVLETIGKIEITEGLPHPTIDGVWGKIAPTASSAYVILDFGEENFDRALEVSKDAGLRYLYHPGPFESWGHFKLDEERFPNGIEGMRRLVERAGEEDVMLGVHTLSNFITPNDPYVTTVPDPRLARVGYSLLSEDIDRTQTTIPIESPDFFNQFENNHLRAAVIGDELIRYGAVSENPPWTLLDCQRGAFGTTAASHEKGIVVAKLADHAYRVFLTNPELSIEVARTIAYLFNQTGLRQISFDGLEGNRSTGMGNYGEVLFTQSWYDALDDNIRRHYIADASRTSHFFWHMYTRMNWGEPWYAGFRESQTEYRLKNQRYFRRNLMPGMLGWFRMSPETSIEDIEWMLARSAAFDAGYAFVTSFDAIESNGHANAILGLLGQWEQARLSGAFTADQKQRMEDINNEFHLETGGDNEWMLFQVHSYKFRHEQKERQPGEPLYSEFHFDNPVQEQSVQFILTADGGTVREIRMEIDNYREVLLPVTLGDGETLQYSGGETAIHYSSNWTEVGEIPVSPSEIRVSPGEHVVIFDSVFQGGDEAAARLEIRLIGPAETIEAE